MARAHNVSKRKVSGGIYRAGRSKRKSELAGFPAQTKVDAKKRVKSKRVIGGNTKKSILGINEINVADGKGKTTKTEIVNVIQNPANPHLVRRNIITKGSIVETKLGKARVTCRPGQESSVNGVLL